MQSMEIANCNTVQGEMHFTCNIIDVWYLRQRFNDPMILHRSPFLPHKLIGLSH